MNHIFYIYKRLYFLNARSRPFVWFLYWLNLKKVQEAIQNYYFTFRFTFFSILNNYIFVTNIIFLFTIISTYYTIHCAITDVTSCNGSKQSIPDYVFSQLNKRYKARQLKLLL